MSSRNVSTHSLYIPYAHMTYSFVPNTTTLWNGLPMTITALSVVLRTTYVDLCFQKRKNSLH